MLGIQTRAISSLKLLSSKFPTALDPLSFLVSKKDHGLAGYGSTGIVNSLNPLLLFDLNSLNNKELVQLGETGIRFGFRANLFWNRYFEECESRIQNQNDMSFHNNAYQLLYEQIGEFKKGSMLNDRFLTKFSNELERVRFLLLTMVNE